MYPVSAILCVCYTVILQCVFFFSKKFQKISNIMMTGTSDYTFGKNFNIAFIFPGGAMICAEKQKLVNTSEVFEKQMGFTGTTDDEASAERIPRIAIKDISFDIFKMMMEHIYGVPIVISYGNYSELLYASRKYFIDDLTQKVIEFLGKFINAKNIAEHFECIDRYEIKMLNDILKKICVRKPLEVIGSLTCSTPHKRILKMILKSPSLPCSEFELHNAILKMLLRQDGIDEKDFRKELGKLIYLIRFPTMTLPELISCAVKPSLLTAEELIACQIWVQYKLFSNTLQFFSKDLRSIDYDTCFECVMGYHTNCSRCGKAF